jgi:lipoprotein-anchoring transpeptidase ErfK/SrfK
MVLLLLGVLISAGCSAVTGGDEHPAPAAPAIKMSPSVDAVAARPDRGLVVRARNGTLTSVVAYAGGEAVPGTLNASRTAWRSDWTLRPDTEYVVNAFATGPTGPPARLAGRFRTLRAPREFGILSVTPESKETVGVGMPIMVTFTHPVQDRLAVEKSLEVRAARPVDGAWHWMNDTQAVYRTRKFWPANQQVGFTAHLSGVRAAPGLYGTADRTTSFTIGRRMVSTVDTRTHQMLVKKDGKVAQEMAISAGMATTREYTTTSGIHLTMEKGNPVRMISPGRAKGDPGFYDVMIGYAVRISNSGEYVHAKNNIWAQGRANVSHGCVNARPDQAAWFYGNALRGDPVIVTGTDRALEWNNGWGYWQLSWDEWLKDSAIHTPAPVHTLVSPAPVPDIEMSGGAVQR